MKGESRQAMPLGPHSSAWTLNAVQPIEEPDTHSDGQIKDRLRSQLRPRLSVTEHFPDECDGHGISDQPGTDAES